MADIMPMTSDDYESVRALWERTPGIGVRPLDDGFTGFSRYLCRNPSTCFVAEEDGVLVGAIMSGHDGRRGYIGHTAVDERHRRKGIGRALVESVLDAMRREGISKVALVAFSDNNEGNLFWERMGFRARDDLVYRDREL